MSTRKAQQHRQNSRIDLGLAVLRIVNNPGEPLSLSEIADVCGCSKSTIHRYEKSALRKVRAALHAVIADQTPRHN